jgi:hypothetical protein
LPKVNTIKVSNSNSNSLKINNNKPNEYIAKKPRISYLPKFASLISTFVPSEKPYIPDPRFSDPKTPTIDLNAYDKKNTNNIIKSDTTNNSTTIPLELTTESTKENIITNNQ